MIFRDETRDGGLHVRGNIRRVGITCVDIPEADCSVERLLHYIARREIKCINLSYLRDYTHLVSIFDTSLDAP